MLFPFSRLLPFFWDDLPFPPICQLSSLQSLINDDVLTTCCLSAKKGLLRINFCKQDRETRNTQFRQTGEKQQTIQPNKGQKREHAGKKTRPLSSATTVDPSATISMVLHPKILYQTFPLFPYQSFVIGIEFEATICEVYACV